ncbi:MAG: hypothetical protein M3347_02980 [Armatimonadota bacterium]|nr:hypothetical protein [Armatimonadota bacterium]
MTELFALQSGQETPGSTAAISLWSIGPWGHASGEYAGQAGLNRTCSKRMTRRNGRGTAFSTEDEELWRVLKL